MKTRFKTSALMTPFAFGQMMILDATMTGTPNYMGIAYYWHYAYRHALRNCTPRHRIKVHDAFIKAKLPLDGESMQHTAIIRKYCPNW